MLSPFDSKLNVVIIVVFIVSWCLKLVNTKESFSDVRVCLFGVKVFSEYIAFSRHLVLLTSPVINLLLTKASGLLCVKSLVGKSKETITSVAQRDCSLQVHVVPHG